MVVNASQGSLLSEQWIVCQIGAREHYVLPAELHRRGQLAALCTDIWAGNRSLWRIAAHLPSVHARRLRDRYEPALRGARVFFDSPVNFGARAIVGRLTRARSNW